MATYTYSIINDFPNGLETSQLQTEIKTNITNISRIDTINDEVDIVFDATLSEGNITTLNGIIASHVPYYPPTDQFIIPITKGQSSNTSFTALTTFEFPGLNNVKNINVISYNPYSSYTLKLLDITNNNIIAEELFTNTSVNINTFATISNIPSGTTILELQSKSTLKKKKTYIGSITFHYRIDYN